MGRQQQYDCHKCGFSFSHRHGVSMSECRLGIQKRDRPAFCRHCGLLQTAIFDGEGRREILFDATGVSPCLILTHIQGVICESIDNAGFYPYANGHDETGRPVAFEFRAYQFDEGDLSRPLIAMLTGRLIIGHGSKNAPYDREPRWFIVSDEELASAHAEVSYTDDHYSLRPYREGERTFLNGREIVGAAKLAEGNVIGVGRSRFGVQLKEVETFETRYLVDCPCEQCGKDLENWETYMTCPECASVMVEGIEAMFD